jgi:N-acyl homoserine lactone hydrolase
MTAAVAIHPLQTGTVSIKPRQLAGRGPGALRGAGTMLSRGWTPRLPTIAWFVDHPEGGILVDTGETARALEPGYAPRWHPYFRLAVREQLTAEQEVVPLLRSIGRTVADVRWLVFTHLHIDHVGGLAEFPNAEIIVSARELADARGCRGKVRGYLPQHWPEWFAPRELKFDAGVPVGAFEHAVPLTSDRRVLILPTPGHTPGHLSVLVSHDDHDVLLAGDASYTQAHMLAGQADGVTPIPRAAHAPLHPCPR